MMLRTKECWCSRLGWLRKPILTSPQAQGPLEAQEVRHRAVLAEVAMVPEDLHVPPEPPEAPGPGGS